MAVQETVPGFYGVSRSVHSLARAAGLREDQIKAVGPFGATPATLAAAAPKDVANATGLDAARAGQLVNAAAIFVLGSMPARLAVELARLGATRAALAKQDPQELLKQFGGIPGVTLRDVSAWMVAAGAAETRVRGGPPAEVLAEVKTPKLGVVPIPRSVLVSSDMSWSDVATTFYDLRGRQAKEWAATLAAANRSTAESRVTVGSAILLPADEARRPKLPDPARAAADLRAFSPALDDDQARGLAAGGVVSPALLPATARVANPEVFGISADLLRQLRLQAQLAAVPGISAELAYYLAVVQPRSLSELSRSNPVDLAAELARARALSRIPPDTRLEVAEIARWLAELLGRYTIDVVPGTGSTSVCERGVPPTSHLENYYAYRFSPAGRSAEALSLEITSKQQWLAEVDDYLAGPPSATRNEALVRQGVSIGSIHLDDLRPWGGSVFQVTSRDTLLLLRDFLRDNTTVVRLLQCLAEGHEAYRFREYGLALAAYQRAEDWFATQRPRDNPPAAEERWWRNEPDAAGNLKPSFVVMLERYPDDLSVQLAYQPVGDYYTARAAAADRNTLLETLQLELPDYHKWRLHPALEGSPGVPFRKFVYYISNFLIPMAKGDCYARLGNYCVALDQYMRVWREDPFTAPLPGPQEDTIVRGVEGTTGPVLRYATLSSFSPGLPPEDNYYTQFLNDVEKRVVRLRVADTILSWGDAEYRRGDLASAIARYAQVLRILYQTWDTLRGVDFTGLNTYRAQVDAANVNPRAAALAFTAHQQLLKLARSLNYLGYPEDYVPVWTYSFLLTTGRYFAERARQSGRDALQFRANAEQEEGNRRLLAQAAAVTQAQLAVETRRVDEAASSIDVAAAGAELAAQRQVNSQSRKEELEAFAPARQALGILGGALGGASSGASIGGIGGGVGAAGGAVAGATFGGVTAYISGQIEMQSQRNELERQRLELVKAQDMADAEVTRAQIGTSVARLSRAVAALHAIFAQSNLEFAQAKALSAEFWFESAIRMSDIASDYLERAIGVAFLTEQAYEFMEGRRLDVIRYDYSQSEGVLAADALLADLDSIEYERVSGRLTKVTPVKYVHRLRERDFLTFAEVKRTGRATFETPLIDFDLAHPGSYHQRISSIEVEVRALTTPSGIRGTLRKGGLSYLRYRTGAAGTSPNPPNTAADWIQHTANSFRMAPVVQHAETLILSPFDARKDSILLRPDPGEQLRVFEGSGTGATWTLTLCSCENDFDLATITDISLIIYYYAQHDDALAEAVNLERRKLIALGMLQEQRARGFSLREMFPDEVYRFHNPPFDTPDDQWRERVLTLEISPGLFPANQLDRKLKGITLVFVGERDYLNVNGRLSTTGLNLAPTDFQATESDTRIRAALGQDHAPEGTWTLAIRAADNAPGWTLPGLYRLGASGQIDVDASGQPIPDAAGVPVFDPAKLRQLKDIWLIFNYSFTIKGDCGDPAVAWADFASAATITIVQAGAVVASNWLTDALQGAPAWGVVQGVMQQTAVNAESILSPVTPMSLADLAISGRVHLASTVGSAAGFALRYVPPAGAQPSGDLDLVRLTRLAGNLLEVALVRKRAGVFTTALRRESAALAAASEMSLRVRASGSRTEVQVNDSLTLRDGSAVAIPGSIGLYAQGAGVGFAGVVVSDLTGR